MSYDRILTERMYETSSGSASTMRSRACLAIALQLFVICTHLVNSRVSRSGTLRTHD